MTPDPTTVRPDSDPVAANMVLRYSGFWHLPVVDEEGAVVGVVDGADLERFLEKAGSPGVVKRQHRVEQAISRQVVTVPPDCPLETAAGLMIEHKIRCLTVVEEGAVVGIITETDIFRQFATVLGGGSGSLRLTVQMPNAPGLFAKLTGCIARVQGDITSFVGYPDENPERYNAALRVEGVDRERLLAAISEVAGCEVLHAWGCEGDQTTSP